MAKCRGWRQLSVCGSFLFLFMFTLTLLTSQINAVYLCLRPVIHPRYSFISIIHLSPYQFYQLSLYLSLFLSLTLSLSPSLSLPSLPNTFLSFSRSSCSLSVSLPLSLYLSLTHILTLHSPKVRVHPTQSSFLTNFYPHCTHSPSQYLT